MEDGPFLLGPKEMEQAEMAGSKVQVQVLCFTSSCYFILKDVFRLSLFFYFAQVSCVSFQIYSFVLFICDDIVIKKYIISSTPTIVFGLLLLSFFLLFVSCQCYVFSYCAAEQ